MEIQKRCREEPGLMTTGEEGKPQPVGVGIGIHTGQASIGEVGTAYKDFTIIGPVVNTASRIQSAAPPDDILVTEEVYGHVADLFRNAEARSYQLKGIHHPVNAYLLR